MLNKVLLVVAIAVLSVGVWFLLEKTHPFFSVDEILAEGKSAGGMSDEMTAKYRAEMLKSDCVSFAIWGGVLAAFSGGLASVTAKRRALGAVVGLVAGVLLGVLAAYLGTMHDFRFNYEPASSGTYWIVRWCALVVPLALAAGVAAGLSEGGGKALTDGIVAGIVGAAISVIVITLLVGVVTPNERHEFIYPAFWQTRLLAIAVSNIAVFGILLLQLGKTPKADAVNEGPGAVANNDALGVSLGFSAL